LNRFQVIEAAVLAAFDRAFVGPACHFQALEVIKNTPTATNMRTTKVRTRRMPATASFSAPEAKIRGQKLPKTCLTVGDGSKPWYVLFTPSHSWDLWMFIPLKIGIYRY